jgi:two-component system chemotaxis response regulator CheB
MPAIFGDPIVAIGASIEGEEALLEVLSRFPRDCPPTLVAMPMPVRCFTASLAARLDRLCAPHVTEAQDCAPLTRGQVWLAPGGPAHLEVSGRTPRCRLVPDVSADRPSIDRLFHSLARCHPRRTIGVILAGEGDDGAGGLGALAAAGAQTIGLDEATSAVYEMPRAAIKTGAVLNQLPLAEIGPFVLELCSAATAG